MRNNAPSSARVCFIGSGGLFSVTAFQTLCAHDITITQAILAGHAPASPPATSLPVSAHASSDTMPLHSLAMRRDIPVTFLGHTKNRQQQWQSLCSDSTKTPRPDFIFVACFPEKLPAVTRQWPRHKSINLHPSLLPKYRGPDPIFWQLRHNETQTGISLHELSEQWDAGAILHQQDVAFPAGASRAELNTLLAQQGTLAFIRLITKGTLSAREQDAAQASYFPLATENDYLIDPDWTAEQTNNFIRGNDLTA